ncbi:MAG: hypothetical protein U0S48_21255 [Solirubrobacteraceae bacterium]
MEAILQITDISPAPAARGASRLARGEQAVIAQWLRDQATPSTTPEPVAAATERPPCRRRAHGPASSLASEPPSRRPSRPPAIGRARAARPVRV